MLFQKHGKRLGMIGMFVGDEDGIDVGKLFSDRAKRTLNGAAAHTGIDQDTGIADTHQRTVALGAGKQRNDAVDGGFQNKFLS